MCGLIAPGERTDFYFILVARIDENDVGVRNEFIPFGGWDVCSSVADIDVADSECDDLFLETHLHFAERLML